MSRLVKEMTSLDQLIIPAISEKLVFLVFGCYFIPVSAAVLIIFVKYSTCAYAIIFAQVVLALRTPTKMHVLDHGFFIVETYRIKKKTTDKNLHRTHHEFHRYVRTYCIGARNR